MAAQWYLDHLLLSVLVLVVMEFDSPPDYHIANYLQSVMNRPNRHFYPLVLVQPFCKEPVHSDIWHKNIVLCSSQSLY